MRLFPLTAAALIAASPALAEFEETRSAHSVATTIDRLEEAVTAAGATVFARVNHAEGAASVDMDLPAAEVLIFGNPKLGTQAMQADITAGLLLPMRALAYEDADGQVWLTWQEPEDMFDDLDIDDDADYLDQMEKALETLAGKATGD
ncbi:DUF302 domain-containing protein [Marivita sp. S2033]|uniref:DUF302 domain-containing protein n=1 Tax=Marivita sp. S2033 TaxID=3373187 RepID=UPI0039823CA4